MELFKNTNFDFLGKKWPFIIASLILTAAGLVSLVVNGGPKYGIDFRGGANLYAKFAGEPPVERLRTALAARIPGEITVQPIYSGPAGTSNEVVIGIENRDGRQLDAARQTVAEAIASVTGQAKDARLDVNAAGQAALADRLRVPLQNAKVSLTEAQLQTLTRDLLAYRDAAPRSGVVRSVDDLATVPNVNPAVLGVLKQELTAAPFAIRNVEVVGPKVGNELRQQAINATLLALAGMLVYIGFRFEWIYGVAAVIAVFHDTIITLGLFSLFDKEITLTVVAALLTLVGYSMNDTIVVFDRIRENLKMMRRESLANVVNLSVNQTLSRTTLTSGLTLLTALALLLFGGPVLHGFAFALVAGIIVGTFSSIFIASPILIYWQGLLERRKRAMTTAPAAARAAMPPRGPVKTAK